MARERWLNNDDLVEAVIADISGQNWSDTALTDDEMDLIGMAVQSTISRLKPDAHGQQEGKK